MSSVSQDDRDDAIATFFKVLTGILAICKPLIEKSVREAITKAPTRG